MQKQHEKQEHVAGHLVEDVTKYGEFVSTYYRWLTPEQQAQRARHLAREIK